MRIDDWPFIGSEALTAGLVRKHELRAKFVKLYPDVYLASDVEPTIDRRARAAWLWSHRQGVVAGLTASGLHGAKWIDPALPVELIWSNARRPSGVRTHDYRVPSDEFQEMDGMRVTTVPRTAFDIGRRGRLNEAVARLDALGNAAAFCEAQVRQLMKRHRGARGVRTLARALDLHDPGAESPQETWLRLLLINAGFPRPQTQIPVLGPDGRPRYYLDMGWEGEKIAVEYDGDHHRVDRATYKNDIIRAEYLSSIEWTVIRVTAGDRRSAISARVRAAINAKLR